MPTIDITKMSSRQISEALNEAFLKDLRECFEEVFYELAGECMELAIHKDVYAKYKPSYYQRRKNHGGLSDPRNFNIDIFRDGDDIVGYVKNTATGVGRAWRLDEAIVEGNQYDWCGSRIYNMQALPRDFYKGTIERIEKSRWQYHVRRLMNQRGWVTRGK